MAFNFRESALKSTTLSELMNGRIKVSTDEIIQKFPNGFTIEDFDVVDDKKSQYPVFTVKEDKTICFFGGTILMNMVDGWLAGFETIDECRAAFVEEGGLPVKLSTGKTKNGNNITKVDIL